MYNYVQSLTENKNCNLNALFDCCREVGLKPAFNQIRDFPLTADSTTKGGLHIYYAKKNGGLASAGSDKDKLSPMTGAWLRFVRGNLGAQYPDVLDDF